MQPDDLYGLPLDRFVAERAALAKSLRGAGRRDEAAEVAKLRKPSAAAWAVNQLVRTQGRAARELLSAGDAVRAAQDDVLAGRGDARALREAGARERDAVAGLVETARGLLGDSGHELSESTLERVADTLHAAALDDDAREQVRAGRLERELRHAGLGLGDGAAGMLAAAPARGAGKQRTATDREAGRRTAEEIAAAAAAREKARKEARAVAAKAAKREARAGHALRAAEERRDRAAAALAGAEEALDEARTEAAEAAEEHRRARAALDGA